MADNTQNDNDGINQKLLQLLGGKDQPKPGVTSTFGGGLWKDLSDESYRPGMYSHARNATIVLPDGQTGSSLHTECAFELKTTLPYTLIGVIHLVEDQFILFTSDNTTSEIGLYIEGTGTYSTMMNDAATLAAGLPGLGFKTTNLITGSARRNFDCGFDVYWADALNPDRMIDTAFLYPNPWVQDCVTISTCITCTNTNKIDVEKIRQQPQFSIPCLTLAKNPGSGTLPNGSYQATLRFAINGIPCTDFLALSNIQSTFSHNNNGGSVVLNISGISAETTVIFPEIEVVIVSMTNSQVQAKKLGIYSSSQQTISIDDINQELINIPLNLLPISTPIIDKSDAIYSVANYLLRVGTYEKPEFNYQPLANQIIAKWVAVQYPDDYYHKGGLNGQPMNVSSLRGEVYAYYIRWGYTTGDKSASYSIPGLPSGTAPTISIGGPSPGDGGITIASGRFEGYSSTERYPNDESSIWGSLCGQPIMHHKFPTQNSFPGTILSHFNPITPFTISVMGVYFENIQPPVDINGVIIPNIQGYEILRAVRDGNKSVVGCGMINHMRGYVNPDGTQGIYQNYPNDDLNPDIYLTSSQVIGTVGGSAPDNHAAPLTIVHSDLISFHSPDTVFRHPELGSGILNLRMVIAGSAIGNFHQTYKHPKFKVLTDRSSQIGTIIGVMVTVANLMSTLSGSGTNLQLAASDDIPITTPLGLSAIAEGTLGATSDIIYIAGLAAAITLTAVLAPLQERIIQGQIMNVIAGLVPEVQYAWQYDSHGYYDIPIPAPQFITPVRDYEYISSHLQSFDNYTVNNLFRNDYVLMNLANGVPSYPAPYNTPPFADVSRFTLSQAASYPGVIFSGNLPKTKLTTIGPFSAPIVSWYASYNIPQPSQYGQVDSPKQVPIGCIQFYRNTTMTSGVMFGGDTYINRYTEKNPMMFFNDWLVDTAPDFPYDYTTVTNVPYPRYWINNTKVYYDFWQQAGSNWHVDQPDLGSVVFGIGLSLYLKNGYFYLFCNGVRDFYVESDVNVGFRDWEDVPEKRFYDPYAYTSLDYLFRADIIKNSPLYKYDYSLSAGKFWNQYLSWGQCLDRDYNPILAYTCYNYYPRRVIYSLPQEEELRKDNWKVFLPNNYIDMPTKVTAVKDIGRTGALFFLADQAPQSLPGVECQPLYSLILTLDGWKRMGEISINDKIAGRDGNFYNILYVNPIIEKPIYEITFDDGSSVKASDSHYWNVLDPVGRQKASCHYLKEKTKTTLDLNCKIRIRDGIRTPDPIIFPEKEFFISPYTIGVLIADGCMVKSENAPAIYVSSDDISILERVKKESQTDCNIITTYHEKTDSCLSNIRLIKKSKLRRKFSNPYSKTLNDYKLHGCKSIDKFIPNDYLFGSIEQRKSLLQGLLDCDGSICKNGKISYSTTSYKLTQDLIKLVESLGGIATYSVYKRKTQRSKDYILEYRIRLQVNFNPFYLERKRDRFKIRKFLILRFITKVEFIGNEFARCIKTDAPDELYITDNYILTHNTMGSKNGTEYTIGTGLLFKQSLQSITNVDDSYQYGSCQNRLGIISTPYGIFWASQSTGKIFHYNSTMKDITEDGVKFWSALYVPSKLLQQFPTYPLYDNPVSGVGMQLIYDNTNEIVYICKKDYQVNSTYRSSVTLSGNNFQVFNVHADRFVTIKLGDPTYFDDCSWTLSYFPKEKRFISHHDWSPSLNIPAKTHPLLTSTLSTDTGNQLWRMNNRTDLFCNYFGRNFPFEVEYPVVTGSTMTTLQSISVVIESYLYQANKVDRFLVYDGFVDQAIISNREQCSGLLELNLRSTNDIYGNLNYPIQDAMGTQVLYSRKENTWTINQFVDLTKDRGEYDLSNQNMFTTDPNGYSFSINYPYLDPNKPWNMRKRFRARNNFIFLRKVTPGNKGLSVIFAQTKNQISPR